MKIISMAAAAALTLLLLLAAACGSPKAPQSSTPPSSEEGSSALPPESLEFDQEHDHSGLPGLELPFLITGHIFLVIATLFSLISGIIYAKENADVMKG